MLSKTPVAHLKPSLETHNFSIYFKKQRLCNVGFCCVKKSYRKEHNKLRFKVVGQSQEHKRKLNDIDTNALQERLSSWLSKTQNFLKEKTMPLVQTSQTGKSDPGNVFDTKEMEDLLIVEKTIDSRTPNGVLSLAAIVSIEQFSRLNGMTGQRMQKIFKALVPGAVYNDTRNLVEYCCFRFLSRDNTDFHPSLKEPAFRGLIFVTMLAWDDPYLEENDSHATDSEKAFFQGKLVGEEAFVRIASAIPGVADRPTAHNLFKALSGDEEGVSLNSWLIYVEELLNVHKGRKTYRFRECPEIPSTERILCIGSSRKRPVLKWKNNMAWPGKLTLTDKTLYFEAVGLQGKKDTLRFDLTMDGLRVKKAKVGPMGSDLFDSAVSISSGSQSEPWVLEFIDFGGELRRDIWHAFISEVVSLHKFIVEYGPADGDRSLHNVYGAHKGKEKAANSAINSIARLQALQYMRKLLDDPIRLVQFSYLSSAPYGDVVCQTLAVNFWGGPLIGKSTKENRQPAPRSTPSGEVLESNNHVLDIDGSVYLRKWMRSPSWYSSVSSNFWKNASIKNGIVLSKNHVVADATLVEKAARICREKYQVVQKTQATIDAATLQGIPNNIDLFKELILPVGMIAKNFERLRRWEEPHLTISFLVLAYTIIFRDLLSYIFPMTIIILASGMLTLKGLKEQGRLGRSFGRVTIHDQPRSNTIQKIIAVKDAMRDVEKYLQNLNVTLLKIRSIILSGQPQITTEVALVLLSFATILLTVPFKYVLAFLIFDLFTRELEFRREMVKRFMSFVKERWDAVPAAPVVVLPFASEESTSLNQRKETGEQLSKQSDKQHA